MIIKYPTGSYTLPSDGQRGNITFTVSAGPPPRSSLLFAQLPGQSGGSLPAKTYSDSERAADSSRMAYTDYRSATPPAGGGPARFEPGQLIDFGDEDRADGLPPMGVPAGSTVRHDTGMADLDVLGLSGDEIDEVTRGSAAAFTSLTDRLNALVQRRSAIEVLMDSNQRQVVEANKTILGIDAILASLGDNQAIRAARDEVVARRAAALADNESLVAEANALSSEAQSVRDGLNAVSHLVR